MDRIPEQLIERFARARRVLVITGAGISAESGISTFRGPGGYWRQMNPMALASPAGFEHDPALVWEWYLERRAQIRQAAPNAGHRALAALEARVRDLLVVTQNVDGLHQRAGSQNVIEIHGSLWRTRCTLTGLEYEEGEVKVEGGPLPPLSPAGALLRPAVVWFGEMLDPRPIRRIEEFLRIPPDLALVVGTTAAFGYITDWALAVKRRGALLVEINPEPTGLTPLADYHLRGEAGDLLLHLVPSEYREETCDLSTG